MLADVMLADVLAGARAAIADVVDIARVDLLSPTLTHLRGNRRAPRESRTRTASHVQWRRQPDVPECCSRHPNPVYGAVSPTGWHDVVGTAVGASRHGRVLDR